MISAILLFLGYLAYLVYEKYSNEKRLSSFQYVLHVNGIRGKTSVCRLIDANLRGSGYRVFTKTTGSTPFYIDTHGVEHLIHRKGAADMKEQLLMIKKASKEKADILILECMAVKPALQDAAQNLMVKGRLNVITNVRYDHIFEMGSTLDSIAQSLSNTIPLNGLLFTADEQYYPYFRRLCEQKHSRAILCRPDGIASNENEAIACEIGRYLGIDDVNFQYNVQGFHEDFGAHKLYPLINGPAFLNLFSANDPLSTRMLLNQYTENYSDIVFVYNHRLDRPDRLLLFIRHFFPAFPDAKIILIGENKGLAQRILRKNGYLNTEIAADWKSILRFRKPSLFVGIGNIKGPAYDLITYLEKDDVHERTDHPIAADQPDIF